MTYPSITSELAAIAEHAARLNRDQMRSLRDRILADVHRIEARYPERRPPDDPGRFELDRDRATCARRRREVDYLEGLLNAPEVASA